MFTRLVTRCYSKRPARATLNRWSKTSVKIVGSFGLLWWFTDHAASVVWIEGGSMRPILNPDPYARESDLVLIDRWRYVPDKIQAGDVVCFKSPTHQGRQLIKRVIAVNNSAVPLRIRVHPYIHREEDDKLLQMMQDCANNNNTAINGNEIPVDRDHLARWREVPAGHVWMEGDNHRSSIDSNHYGPIPLALIQGRASHVIVPQSRRWTDVLRVIDRVVPSEASRVKITPL